MTVVILISCGVFLVQAGVAAWYLYWLDCKYAIPQDEGKEKMK
jgi:hypothetical protein